MHLFQQGSREPGVYNASGDKLGSIDDIVIDKLSGQMRYAALEFGGFLGVGTDRYPIPWKCSSTTRVSKAT